MKNNTQFETGAKTKGANNFILSADCNQSFNNQLKEIQYKIWKTKENKKPERLIYFSVLLTNLISQFNGELENVEKLKLTEIADVVNIYIKEVEHLHENDLTF